MGEKHAYRKLFNEGSVMFVLYHEPVEAELSAWAKSVFGVTKLEELHLLPDPVSFNNYVERLYYRVNQLKDKIYEIQEEIENIKVQLLVPLVGEISKYQFPPSIRCHLNGGGTASAFHKDGDAKYKISANSLNLWIPLTRVWGNNSIHIEQSMNSGNFREVILSPGEILLFDAFNLTHGSFPNDTNSSRISLDIRFVPNDITLAQKLGLYANYPIQKYK
ncbi:hypothetical protein Slin_3705 [Spirosoma linguale DSM 74]|uniref:Phytanoyl-CoA dioxygenase n=2 Tax=Spirosoma TaxID=107 RepID=D2QBX2_SPILD|nr:hypothetical protein Slin_3705 [Spirosoma linguale DSM 74]